MEEKQAKASLSNSSDVFAYCNTQTQVNNTLKQEIQPDSNRAIVTQRDDLNELLRPQNVMQTPQQKIHEAKIVDFSTPKFPSLQQKAFAKRPQQTFLQIPLFGDFAEQQAANNLHSQVQQLQGQIVDLQNQSILQYNNFAAELQLVNAANQQYLNELDVERQSGLQLLEQYNNQIQRFSVLDTQKQEQLRQEILMQELEFQQRLLDGQLKVLQDDFGLDSVASSVTQVSMYNSGVFSPRVIQTPKPQAYQQQVQPVQMQMPQLGQQTIRQQALQTIPVQQQQSVQQPTTAVQQPVNQLQQLNILPESQQPLQIAADGFLPEQSLTQKINQTELQQPNQQPQQNQPQQTVSLSQSPQSPLHQNLQQQGWQPDSNQLLIQQLQNQIFQLQTPKVDREIYDSKFKIELPQMDLKVSKNEPMKLEASQFSQVAGSAILAQQVQVSEEQKQFEKALMESANNSLFAPTVFEQFRREVQQQQQQQLKQTMPSFVFQKAKPIQIMYQPAPQVYVQPNFEHEQAPVVETIPIPQGLAQELAQPAPDIPREQVFPGQPELPGTWSAPPPPELGIIPAQNNEFLGPSALKQSSAHSALAQTSVANVSEVIGDNQSVAPTEELPGVSVPESTQPSAPPEPIEDENGSAVQATPKKAGRTPRAPVAPIPPGAGRSVRASVASTRSSRPAPPPRRK